MSAQYQSLQRVTGFPVGEVSNRTNTNMNKKEIKTARGFKDSKERNEAVLQDLREGMSVPDAAVKYGLIQGYIRDIARKHGMGRTKRRRERNEAIARDLRKGMSPKEAAIKYKLSPGRIYQIARKRGARGQTLKRNEAIAKDLRKGMSAKEAATKYGLAQPTISVIANEHSIDLAERRWKRKRERNRKRNHAIAHDLRIGMSIKEVATKYGLTRGSIYVIAKKQGMGRRALEAARNEAITADLREGMGINETATKYGLTQGSIYAIAKKQGMGRGRKRLPARERQKRNQAIIQDLRDGMRIKNAATKYGLDQSAISRIAKKHGIDLVGRYRERTRKLHQTIAADLRKGVSVKAAATKHGVSERTIINTAKKYGIPPNRPA